MTTKTKAKQFDCVEMMHAGGRAVQEATEDMTTEEKVAFWAAQTKKNREQQAERRKRAGVSGENIQLPWDKS